MIEIPDVVVIGGGPGGIHRLDAAGAAGLSRSSCSSASAFPRFHIGESLIPETYWVLKRLNMLPKMQQSHFVKKYSVQFVNASGKLSAPFYFWDNKPHECSQTWQVVRSEFDQMMLENAREHGVTAHEGVRVIDVLWEDDRAVGVTIKQRRRHDPRGARQGRRRRQRPGRADPEPAAAARLGSDPEQRRDLDLLGRRVSRHRPRRRRDDGAADGDKNGWFWYIPQHNNIVSVGVVGAVRLPVQEPRHRNYEQTYQRGSRRVPGGQGACRQAPRGSTGYFATKDYSYRATHGRRRRLGDGRRCLGIPRSALLLRRAAGAASRARWRPTRSSRDWRKATRPPPSSANGATGFNKGVDRMRRLVCEYYDGFSFGNFVRQLPGSARHGDRPADRRSVHRSRGQGVAADGVAVPAGQRHRFRRGITGVPLEAAPEKANELKLPEGWKP